MSQNCVDATIELSNLHETPVFLIASRRQIDSAEFGGGYVNNWTTEQLATYVRDNDKKGMIVLSRDHGGPWQNSREIEKNMGLEQAMDSAKSSYMADIDAGFQKLHIDPSIDIHKSLTAEEVLDRVYELYEFCFEYASRQGKELIFEIGTEEQTGGNESIEDFRTVVSSVIRFTKKNNLPKPSFIVAQTGTKVMEDKNIGTLGNPLRLVGQLPSEIHVPKIIEICNEHSIMLKQHNTDYLSDETLSWLPKLGIHAANVAPEFGVAETKSFVSLLEEHGMSSTVDDFCQLAFDSGKWKKWMIPKSKASKMDKALICGHYIFSEPAFLQLKEKAQVELRAKGIDLNHHLYSAVRSSIERYIKCFRLSAHV